MKQITTIKPLLTAIFAMFLVMGVGLEIADAQYVVDFESETKGSYASGTVTLNGIDWDMTEALIGSLPNDWKNGAKSARMRGYGTSSMSMLGNKSNGLGTISIQYRRFGTDAQVDWRVEYSTNDGVDWTQIGSDFTAPASNDVQSFSETVNVAGNVRIRIKRATESGTSDNRLNIDDITLTDYVPGVANLSPSLTEITDFTYAEGDGPSTAQNFTLTGMNLDDSDVTVTAPTNFEVSTTEGSGYGASVTLAAYDGSSQTIYVRLKAGLSEATYADETITISGGGASDATVTVFGEVTAAPDPAATFTASGFSADFSDFDGGGFSAAPATGQLHSGNWRVTGMSDGAGTFGGEHTSGDFARGSFTGGVGTGGVYHFDVGNSTNILGFQPTGSDFEPGTITLRLENSSGATVENVRIAYDIYVYNNADRSNSFNFAYSTDDDTYTDLTALNYSTPEAADGSPAWVKVERTAVIEGLNIADGDFMYFRWNSDDVSGGGSRDEFGITNVNITKAFSTQLTGAEGYRIISAPVPTTLQALLKDNNIYTQCFTGADYTGDACTGDVGPNVFTFENNGSWAAATNITNEVDAGEAILVYVYTNDDPATPAGDNPWPKTINVSGTAHTIPFQKQARNGANNFTLVGNPTPRSIRFDQQGATELASVVYVWDPNYNDGTSGGSNVGSGSWRSYNGSDGSLTDGIIGAFQGFFIQNSSGSTGNPALNITTTTTGGQFYGKQTESFSAELLLRGEGLANSTWVTFSEQARTGDDDADAAQLVPLSSEYAVLGSFTAEGSLADINNIPFFEGELELPLAMHVTTSGSYELAAGKWNLPDGYTAYLEDTRSGVQTELTASTVVNLELEASRMQKSASTPGPVGPQVMSDVQASPYKLVLKGGTTTDSEIAAQLPAEVTLDQNYPNPFNPTSRINYQLPADMQVRLTVVDMLGREVAVLVDGAMRAGSHSVNFDGSALSSGIYLYRLQAGAQVITRSMTLIK
ncbi:MAG: extracellular protein [Bacteroidetes bacterium HLUCCA01]|nr:MAG: extracellular protein [Bacteroidetes bacterium HLUCCA01]